MGKITIRRADSDDAPAIADCLLLAMGDIACQLVGETEPRLAYPFLSHFARLENNQYSYENCWIAVLAGEVVGVANVYDGGRLEELRRPVFDFISKTYTRDVDIEDETEAGEFYIDCIAVKANQQGKGVGTLLLKVLIEEFVLKKRHTLGLLVDEQNPKAKKLYCTLGFKFKGDKYLLGKRMEHLQLSSESLL